MKANYNLEVAISCLITQIFSGKNQVYMVVGGMLLLVSGSTVAYAKYDETGEFQKKIEKYLPGSGALFGFFHDSENWYVITFYSKVIAVT